MPAVRVSSPRVTPRLPALALPARLAPIVNQLRRDILRLLRPQHPVDTIFPDVAESRPAGQIEVPAGWIVNFAHRRKNVGGIGICHGGLWAEYCRDAAGLARDRNHPVGLERAREIYALSWYSTLGNSQFPFSLDQRVSFRASARSLSRHANRCITKRRRIVLTQAAHIFEGLSTFGQMDAQTIVIRVVLIITGLLLIYLSARDILDPMVLMPMGLAMVLVNGATLTIEGKLANLFVDPMLADPEKVVNSMQIFFLQPIYNLMFSNGLIACLVFMGIGVITPLDYLIASPLTSLLIAIGAELGSILTFPLAVGLGFNYKEAAAIAIVGGADGPMVLFTSLELARSEEHT